MDRLKREILRSYGKNIKEIKKIVFLINRFNAIIL